MIISNRLDLRFASVAPATVKVVGRLFADFSIVGHRKDSSIFKKVMS